MSHLLVIVDNLDLAGARRSPDEADPPLVVDSDAVLTDPVALECSQPVPRWNAEFIKLVGSIE